MSATVPVMIPAGSVERLNIADVQVFGVTDPTECQVETCLSSGSVHARSAGPTGEWETALWTSTTMVATHVIDAAEPGRFGLWLRVTGVQDGLLTGETVILWVGIVEVTGDAEEPGEGQ